MKNFGVKLDRTLDSLVGQVCSVQIQTFDIKNGVRTQTDERKVEYNMRGIKTVLTRYDEFLRVKVKQVIEFNSDGRKAGYINYGMFDDIKSSGKYDYELDSLNVICSKYHNGDCEEQHYYDAAYNIEKVYYPSTGAYNLYKYDMDDFVIEQLDVSENSPFGSLFGPSKRITTYVNDELGNITEVKFYNAETGEPISAHRSVCDNHGNEIQLIIYEKDGSIRGHTNYKYRYYIQNNWILKQVLSEQGNVYREIIRNIIYY